MSTNLIIHDDSYLSEYTVVPSINSCVQLAKSAADWLLFIHDRFLKNRISQRRKA